MGCCCSQTAFLATASEPCETSRSEFGHFDGGCFRPRRLVVTYLFVGSHAKDARVVHPWQYRGPPTSATYETYQAGLRRPAVNKNAMSTFKLHVLGFLPSDRVDDIEKWRLFCDRYTDVLVPRFTAVGLGGCLMPLPARPTARQIGSFTHVSVYMSPHDPPLLAIHRFVAQYLDLLRQSLADGLPPSSEQHTGVGTELGRMQLLVFLLLHMRSTPPSGRQHRFTKSASVTFIRRQSCTTSSTAVLFALSGGKRIAPPPWLTPGLRLAGLECLWATGTREPPAVVPDHATPGEVDGRNRWARLVGGPALHDGDIEMQMQGMAFKCSEDSCVAYARTWR